MVQLGGIFFLLSLTTVGGSKVLQISLSHLNKVASHPEAETGLADIKEAFKNDGVISVTELGNEYITAVNNLRSESPACLEEAHVANFELPDGSLRSTAARSTESLEEFPSCIEQESEVISDTFDKVYDDISALLTRISGEKSLQWRIPGDESKIKKSLDDLEQKDHVHVYRSGRNESDSAMVPYHRDNGLLLLLTSFKDHPLLIKNRDGDQVDTGQVEDGGVLVLIGRGFTDWLLKGADASSRFFAAPHSVKSIGKEILTRTVFARMKVPPLDAVPFRNIKTYKKSFQQFFTEISPSHYGDLCLLQSSDQSQTMAKTWFALKDAECSGNTAYCWMGCLELPSDCFDPDMARCTNWQGEKCCTGDETAQDGCLDMDTSCNWKCKNTTKLLDFCNGYGTDMYMQGFEVSGNEQKNCVILLFQGWILDTRLKFGFGCVGVILLGILVEMLLCLRRMLQGRKAFFWLRNPWRKCSIIALFGLNIACGYLAMLVAMTYSMELFLCMVLGLVIGHAIFNSSEPVGESVDPCCASQRSGPADTASSSSKEELKKEDCECS